MDFERLDASGKNPPKGSKVLKVIHDKTFIIDLFVRESIQNSLDAHDKKSNDVLVEYIIGDFACDEVSSNLSGLNDSFYRKYSGTRSNYIAIRDLHTTGLTGGFRKSENEELGNLYKLVFETFESKGSDETGGSWGLGKTMYSLLGIGIVFYYSRIKTEGGYESRLVGALIENEKSLDHISPGTRIDCSGIGWWGALDPTCPNSIIPITNEEQINAFLKTFNILPFVNEEVGTCVIVPYVEIDELLGKERNRLHRNANEEDFATNGTRPWLNNIVDYLSLATLRWYFPRIDNGCYKFGPKLSVKIIDAINNTTTPVSVAGDYRLFRVMQALYNRAAYENNLPNGYSDYLTNIAECEPIVKQVNITHRRLNSGSVAFVKIPSSFINGPLPYELLGMQETCRTMIGYSRSFGMIVWYENLKINSNITRNDEWILAQFVLNGKLPLEGYTDDENTLEKYIRKTEGASHNGWSVESGTLANSIKTNSRIKILESFAETPIMGDSHVNSLGRELAKLLTPEARSTSTTSTRGGSKGNVKAKTFTYKYKVEKYDPFTIKLEFDLKSSFEGDILVDLQIASDGSSISFKEWKEDVSNEYPFYIESASVTTGGTTVELNADSDVNYISTDSSKWKCELLSLDGYSSHRLQLHRSSQLIISKENLEPQDPQPVVSNEKIQASLVLQIDDSKYMPSIEVTTSNNK